MNRNALIFSLIIFSFFSKGNLIAQKEDHQWIFNWWRIDDCSQSNVPDICGASILDFNQLPPLGYRALDITLDMFRTNAIYCNDDGGIQFYANGQSIFEVIQLQDTIIHRPLTNGEIINYSPKWEWLTWNNENGESKPQGFGILQICGFIPIPDSENLLCLYQNYEHTTDSGYFELWYSLIEKNEQGTYSVTEKDLVLNEKVGQSGNVHACRHANGRDWWMLQLSQDTLYSYLIDPLGVHLDHIQILPFQLEEIYDGQSNFSPNGEWFSLIIQGPFFTTEDESQLMISRFDRCSGKLVDPKLLYHANLFGGNGVCFSPDSKILYRSDGGFIYQYDLTKNDIFTSEVEVGSLDLEYRCMVGDDILYFGAMQLGADHKIYVSGGTQCFFLHRIEFPNLNGEDCKVLQRALELPNYHVSNTPNVNTYRLGPLDGSDCDTLGIDNLPVSRFWYEQDSIEDLTVQFWDVSYFRPEEWFWTFGDGNESQERLPKHTYEVKGIYTVCLTVANENAENTSCQNLELGTTSIDNPALEKNYVSIYPNPVEENTRLVLHHYLPSNAYIRLYNAEGKLSYSRSIRGGENNLQLAGLASGVYFYEVVDGEISLGEGKIIKL